MAYRRLHQAFKHLRFPAKSAPRNPRRGRHAAPFLASTNIEALEERRLLTTVTGGGVDPITGEPLLGDVFDYRQGDNTVVRVTVRGNITAELIGAQVNRTDNSVQIVNLPGQVERDGQRGDVFGGIGQGTGFQTIGGITITDPDTGSTVPANIAAIAAAGPTTFYALVQSSGTVQLVLLTLPPTGPDGVVTGAFTGTVISTINGLGFLDPVNPIGADIQPGSGLLFFAATTQLGSTRLYSVDPTVANGGTPGDEVALTLQDRGQILPTPPPPQQGGQPQTPPNVGTIAFLNGSLYAVINNVVRGAGGGGAAGGTDERDLRQIDPSTAATIGSQEITLPIPPGQAGPGADIDGGDIVGLDQDANGNIIAIQNDDPPQNPPPDFVPDGNVLRLGVNGAITPGETQVLGTFAKLGASAMAFVAGVKDAFTGANGAFIGFDNAQNTFFFVDPRDRAPAQYLYNVYVTQSDLSGEISIGILNRTVGMLTGDEDVPDNAPVVDIFAGTAPPFRTADLQSGTVTNFGPDGQSGGVYIGAISQNIPDPDPTDDESGIAVLNQAIPSAVNFGVLPSDVTTLRPGLIVENDQSIGKFLVGGTITGKVDVRGNMDTFYAGFVATGDPNQSRLNVQASIPDNFVVEGDLRNLITTSSLGTVNVNAADPTALNWVSGFDLRVGGTLGMVKSYTGSFYGSMEVDHLDLATPGRSALSIGRNQKEIEGRFDTRLGANANEARLLNGLGNFQLDEPIFNNDTFAAAEMLGSFTSEELNRGEVVRVDGTLTTIAEVGDVNDYYGVGLMAGQSYQVRLDEFFDGDLDLNQVIDSYERTSLLTLSTLAIGVFDPDGRLIATNADIQRSAVAGAISTGTTSTNGTVPDVGDVFGFTADRPGIYRIAIGGPGDFAFNGGTTLLSQFGYTVTVVGVGDIALGGLVVPQFIYDAPGTGDSASGIEVFRGDVGAIKAGTDDVITAGVGVTSPGTTQAAQIISLTAGNRDPMIAVKNGNLRTLEAGSLGFFEPPPDVTDPTLATPGEYTLPVTFDVPQGDVGLIRAMGITADRTLFIENTGKPIGGDFQLIDGSTVPVAVFIEANGGLGVLRALNMISEPASSIKLNVDQKGNDGTLDLIDVTGNFGTLDVGGPQITTGPGGNVRYIRVGGLIFRDSFFGGLGTPEETVTPAGEAATVIDDSGARVTLRATGDFAPNPDYDPNLPQQNVGFSNDPFLGPRLVLTTYPIRDSGGSVIVDIRSESGLDVSVSDGTVAELSRVEIMGLGAEVVEGPEIVDGSSPTGRRSNLVTDIGVIATTPTATPAPTPTPTPTPAATTPRLRPQDLTLRIRGTATVDVLQVVVTDLGTDNTSGDYDNVNQLETDGAIAFTTSLVDSSGLTQGMTPTELGNAVSIINETPDGEIVNITAESVGTIRARGDLGLPKNHSGAAVSGIAPLTADLTLPDSPNTRLPRVSRALTTNAAIDLSIVQPFNGIREGIVLMGGSAVNIQSDGALGNIIVYGNIGELEANADHIDTPGKFEGIAAPVVVDYVSQPAFPPDVFYPGRILRTKIGEGIAPSGTGAFSFAGLYAHSSFGPISGKDADIRGDIIANADLEITRTTLTTSVTDLSGQTSTVTTRQGFVPTVPIESIRLENGSIINSDILVSASFGDGLFSTTGLILPDSGTDNIKRPIYEIGRILLQGNGGIIGSTIQAADINEIITAPGTFGVINTTINMLTDGRLNRLEANGYGIRGVFVDSGAVNNIVAVGDGTNLSTNAVNERVRYGEKVATDPILGTLNPFSFDTPNPLTDIHAALGTVTFNLANNQPVTTPELAGVTDTGVIERTSAKGQLELGNVSAYQIRGNTALDFGNSIGTITTKDVINGLEVTTGTFKNFQPTGDVFNLEMNVRGRLKNVNIKGSLADNSSIKTIGSGGKIDNINIGGNLIGSITSQTSIKSISIGGDFTGNVTLDAGGSALKLLKVGGAFLGGSFDIRGNVGTIQTAGSLGALGDTLTINGNLSKLLVGGDLRSNVKVTGSVKTFQVNASIVDGGVEDGVVIDVDKTINSLIVGNDIQPGVKIVTQAIKKQTIGGQNAGEIVLA